MRDVGHVVVDRAVGGLDDRNHRQVEPLREGVVALVVGGDGHDRAGAVVHQDVVGDPDRDPRLVDRVRREEAGEDTRLLGRGSALLALAGGRVLRVLAELVPVRRALREALDQRVLGREDEEGRAEERVGPRREDRDVDVELLDPEQDLGALGAPDPVSLHRQDALGPVLEQGHLVEQPVGVGGDAEEPLLQVARLDLGAAALAAAVDHLLVREHGLVDRAPLDGRLLPVRQAGLQQPEEQELRPAVVLGLVGRELARPVDRPAHAMHLLADRRRCCGR